MEIRKGKKLLRYRLYLLVFGLVGALLAFLTLVLFADDRLEAVTLAGSWFAVLVCFLFSSAMNLHQLKFSTTIRIWFGLIGTTVGSTVYGYCFDETMFLGGYLLLPTILSWFLSIGFFWNGDDWW
jgi:hypothetical protein